MGEIVIRPLVTYDECQQVREIQRRCWGFTEEDQGLYPPLLLSVAHNGGTVLGAFEGERMVGYLFGYPALHDLHGQRRLKIYSQTMGVLPEYRNRGIAERLKRAQRDHALALGIELITWTFDPLESANAYLNLHKLGALARTYKRNLYGEHFGKLNEGQPTDRFLVEWWLNKPSSVVQTWSGVYCITQVEGTGAEQRLVAYELDRTDEAVMVEIPASIQAIRRVDLARARAWRFKTREIFETYFARGYAAVDLIRSEADGEPHCYYVLTHCVEVTG